MSLTFRRGRAAAATAAVALLAGSLLVGPLSIAAQAAPVTTESDFRSALAALPCSTGPYVIEIDQDITFSTAGDPVYTCSDDLTIQSTAGNHFSVDGSGVAGTRFLDASASAGTLTVTDLTVTGFSVSVTGDSTTVAGGAITAGGPVTIEDSTFTANAVSTTGDDDVARGGAVYAAGALTVSDSTVSNNSATVNGGDSNLAEGGAFYSDHSVTDTGSSFASNSVSAVGCTASSANGGAIGSVASGPTAVDLTDSSFDGNHGTADNQSNGGAVYAHGELYATGATFTNNTTTVTGPTGLATGGAIAVPNARVDVRESTFTGNSATATGSAFAEAHGGAISAYGDSYVVDSTLTNNSVAGSAGGFGATVSGGAIYGVQSLSIFRSLLQGNSANSSGSAVNSVEGGAIATHDTLTAYNVTATGNVASSSVADTTTGGAFSAHSAHITFSVLTDNSAELGSQAEGFDGLVLASVFTHAATGTDNCYFSNSTVSVGYNFDDDESCAATTGTDLGNGADPMLGALADNGGLTLTMQPQAGSPLIDTIPSGVCPLLLLNYTDSGTDARGVSRSGADCDTGSVEVLPDQTFDIVTPAGTIHGTVSNSTGVSGAAYVDPATLTPIAPAGVSLPYGALSFTVAVPVDGWSAAIVLDLPGAVDQLWKQGASAWTQVTGASVVGTQITYTLTDGAAGDSDGTANSVIVDPVAPALVLTGSDAAFRTAVGNLANGSSGCDGSSHVIEIPSDITFANAGDPIYDCPDDLTIRSTAGNHFTVDGSGVADTRFLDASGSAGTITIEDLTITGFGLTNVADFETVYGGAIVSGGDITITDSTFANNTLKAEGDSVGAEGGAIYASVNVTVTDSVFTNNTAWTSGGAAGSSYGGAIASTADVGATGSTFTGNTAGPNDYGTSGGGALASSAGSVNVATSTFIGNMATSPTGPANIALGGAIYSYTAAEADDSEFTNNSTDATGTVVSTAAGGALFSPDDVDVWRSTFVSNSVTIASAPTAFVGGGAVASESSTSFLASTATGNSASDSLGAVNSLGGAIYTATGLALTSTLVGNSADTGSQLRSGTFSVIGSIFADAAGAGDNCAIGTLGTAEANFDDDESCAPTAGTNIGSGLDPELGALGDNGGPTRTMVPDTGSPLLDGIGSAVCSTAMTIPPASTDQRGIARNVGSAACDIGAVERLAPITFTLFDGGANAMGTVTVTNAQSLDSHSWSDASSYSPTPPAAQTFPFGIYHFSLGVPSVDAWPVGIHIDTPSAITELWKDNGGWSQVSGATISGTSIDYTVTNNGSLDASSDLATITDPVAPAFATTTAFTVSTPGGGTITGSVDGASCMDSTSLTASAVSGSSSPTPPAGYTFPYGVFSYGVCVPASGDSVTVTLTLPSAMTSLWKVDSAWAQVSGATISGSTVTYTVTDGGPLDTDPTPGHITDPVGAAFATTTAFTVDTPGGTINGTVAGASCIDDAALTATAVTASYSPAPPSNLSLPFGVFSYGVCVPAAGDSVTVTLTLPSPATSLWKVESAWAEVTGAAISGTTISYTVTDGGTLDTDSTPGHIIDPVGAAIAASFTG